MDYDVYALQDTELLPALYGSQIQKSRACAKCSYHQCYLTVAMVKQHQCLKKNCDALHKETHDYWRFRQQKKELRKRNKAARQY